MKTMHTLLLEFMRLLSELEAMFVQPNDNLRLRKLYLRMNKVTFGKSLWVGRSFSLSLPINLALGERCALGNAVKIENHAMIEIGDDFTGSSGLFLASGAHIPENMLPKQLPIIIGNRVYCGVNVTILAGVTIGDDVVIGAGSLVCRDIPSNSVAAGVPAKVIRPLDRSREDFFWTWASR